MITRTQSLPLAAALALPAAPAGATLIAQFDFDGDLTNSVGGSSITAAHVDGSAGAISFATNAGKLTLTNPNATASNIDYISTNYTPGDNGTIAFRHEAEALYNYNSLFTNSINPDDWEMWIYSDGRVRARVESDGPVTTTAAVGVEAHYAFTWERSGTSVTVNLYKDGTLVETKTGTWRNPGTMSFGGGNGNHGGRGVFDDLHIYDTALSAAEVAVIATPGPDLTDPELASVNPLSPADDSTEVPISANLAVTFNESVVFGTGSITIRESVGNGLVESFDVETSTKLLLSARTVTIDPTNDLSSGIGYYVEIDASAVDDLAGHSFAGISGPTTWNFTADATNPVVGTLDTPSNGATDVPVDSSLDLTFSEDVQIGSGNIVIRRSSDNSIVDTINVTTGDVTVNGALVSITPNIVLPAQTELYVEVAAGVFIDLSGNSFAGISGSGTWSFTTGAVPVPFRLTIVSNGPDFDFSWTSMPGKVYDLLSSTDLSTPSDSWPVYDPDGAGGNDPYLRIPSAGATTTLTSVPTDGPRRFFVMREKKQVLVEAHRGYSQIAPENTVAAINAAFPSADLVEFDVRITSDGELVLMHDGTVNRTTDGSGSTSSLTLAQIQLLDAGSWFSPAFVGEPVPTMTEAINACLAKGMVPLIERKAGAAADYHAEFVAQGFTPGQFRVISFDINFLAALDALNPDYRLGLLSGVTITQAVIDNLKSKGVDFLDWGHGSVDQAAVDLVHANGMELHVYTVNDSTRMQQLIDIGVDGITTDNPVLLRSLLP